MSSIPGVTSGLTHYWPINSDLNDYVGWSELKAGVNVNTSFGMDRFNKSNSSISMNSGYYYAPSGVYFTGGSFTISGWVYPIAFNRNSFLLSFGNGPASDNIYLSITNENTGYPYLGIWKGATSLSIIGSTVPLVIGQWAHLTGVYNVGSAI